MIFVELAKVLNNCEHCKDLKRLKDGEVGNMGIMMAGNLNIDMSKIALLAFPTPTHDYITFLNKTMIRG